MASTKKKPKIGFFFVWDRQQTIGHLVRFRATARVPTEAAAISI